MKPERKAPVGTIIKEVKRNDWQTPEHILERVEMLAKVREVGIALDPATAWWNPTGALRYYSPGGDRKRNCEGEWLGPDGLSGSWAKNAGGGLVFVNPPYGSGADGKAWREKIAFESRVWGTFMVALLNVNRTEQPDTLDLLAHANAACFIRGRVAFINPDTGDKVNGNPFSSWLLGFNVPSFRRWREALEPVCGTTSMMAKGEKSLCVELRAL